MPFEISPDFKPQTEVGPYQHIADAILRGCMMTLPTQDKSVGDGTVYACVALAAVIGGARLGLAQSMGAYWDRYNTTPTHDFIKNGFTREQIAGRIAALR